MPLDERGAPSPWDWHRTCITLAWNPGAHAGPSGAPVARRARCHVAPGGCSHARRARERAPPQFSACRGEVGWQAQRPELAESGILRVRRARPGLRDRSTVGTTCTAGCFVEHSAPRTASKTGGWFCARSMQCSISPAHLPSVASACPDMQSVVDSGLTHSSPTDPCNPCRRVRARRVVVMEDHGGIFRRSVTSYSPSQSAAAAAAASSADAQSGRLARTRPWTSPARATSAPRASAARAVSPGRSRPRQEMRPQCRSSVRSHAARPPRGTDRRREERPRRFFTDAVKVANWQPLASPVRPELFAARAGSIDRRAEPLESWSARLAEVESGMPLRRAMWTAPGPMGRMPPAERKAFVVERLRLAHRLTISQCLPSELRQQERAGSVVGFGTAESVEGSSYEQEWDPVGFSPSEPRNVGRPTLQKAAADADGAFDEELWARFGVESCQTAGSSGSDPRADTGPIAVAPDAVSALRRAGSVGLQSPRRQAKPPAPKHSITRKY